MTQKNMPPKNEADKIRSFAMLLQNLEGGALEEDLSRELVAGIAMLNDYYMEHRGTPSMTISLTLKITKDGINMDSKAEYTVKTPKIPRERTALFCTPDNFLTKKNPNQREFAFREVDDEHEPNFRDAR